MSESGYMRLGDDLMQQRGASPTSKMREAMLHDLEQTTALLARTPATLDALLRDLPDAWTLRNEGENTWSAFDIVGHLIHGERTD